MCSLHKWTSVAKKKRESHGDHGEKSSPPMTFNLENVLKNAKNKLLIQCVVYVWNQQLV